MLPVWLEGFGVPRYFFHTFIEDRLIWDAAGQELPSLLSPEDPELSFALWSEVFDWQLQVSRNFVLTDEVGKVLFVTSRWLSFLFLARRAAMLRFPMFGFSRRVDDTVARAMAILNTREDFTSKLPLARLSTPATKPKKPSYQREE
jgi:hypothetical protein